MLKKFSLPSDIRIVISPACNLNCIYCHREGVKRRKINNENLHELIERKIENFFQVFNLKKKIKEITITGGEPTLFGESILKLIDYFKGKTNNITLITNGTTPKFLLKHAHHFKEIHLHLDVIDDFMRKKLMGKIVFKKGDIERLFKIIKRKTNFRINSVVDDRCSIEHFLATFLWAKNKNIKIAFIKPLMRESKNFYVLEKLVALANYRKVEQKNVAKNIYTNLENHVVEFILCDCDIYPIKYPAKIAANKCLKRRLVLNLSDDRIYYCFLKKGIAPDKFMKIPLKFFCPLAKKFHEKEPKKNLKKEYEIRSQIRELDKIKIKIEKEGFIFREKIRLCDFIYYPPGTEKIGSGDAVIRIRVKKIFDKIITALNIKEKINNKEWLEWETGSVANPIYLFSLLNKLYQPRMILDRIRTTYFHPKTKTKIEIDEFQDILGNFIEIEGEKLKVKSLYEKFKLKNKLSQPYGNIIEQRKIRFNQEDFKKKINTLF